MSDPTPRPGADPKAPTLQNYRAEPLRLFPNAETRRLNLNLPEEELERLRQLAEGSGRTMTDCVRAALRLLFRAAEEERQGNRLAFLAADGTPLQEVTLGGAAQPTALRVRTGTRAGVVVHLAAWRPL